jgi:hypothetical protein
MREQSADRLPWAHFASSNTVAETSAIQDAVARNKDRCGSNGRSCDVIVSGNDNGHILVGVHFLVPSESSGTCAQRIGDETLFVYTKDGQYIESIPGM